jgi:hypothetical protein
MTPRNGGSCNAKAYRDVVDRHNHTPNGSLKTLHINQIPTVLITRNPAHSEVADGEALEEFKDAPTLNLPTSIDSPLLEQNVGNLAGHQRHDSSGENSTWLANADINEYCSDASSCNYQKDHRLSRTLFRGQSRPSGMKENDSDSDDNGSAYHDDDMQYAWDSDLESVSSEPDRMTHAKKMRKWKSLARGRFEKMLLDCIVNTGL